jgi:hypothetical protein
VGIGPSVDPCHGTSGVRARPIGDELEREESTDAADVADEPMTFA